MDKRQLQTLHAIELTRGVKTCSLLVSGRKHSDFVERTHTLVTELSHLAHRILNPPAITPKVPSHYQHDTRDGGRHSKEHQRELPVEVQHVGNERQYGQPIADDRLQSL